MLKKKEAKERHDQSQSEENWNTYKIRNKEAKKAVAQARAKACGRLCAELDTKGEQNKIFKLSKARNNSAKYITQVK